PFQSVRYCHALRVETRSACSCGRLSSKLRQWRGIIPTVAPAALLSSPTWCSLELYTPSSRQSSRKAVKSSTSTTTNDNNKRSREGPRVTLRSKAVWRHKKTEGNDGKINYTSHRRRSISKTSTDVVPAITQSVPNTKKMCNPRQA
ncbi:unnamed protein product, partial [Scytosiphon promiscuus]